jgi:hypothetical protein
MPRLVVDLIIVFLLALLVFVIVALLMGGSLFQVNAMNLQSDIRYNCCSIYNCSAGTEASIQCKVGNKTKTFSDWLSDINVQSAQNFCFCK